MSELVWATCSHCKYAFHIQPEVLDVVTAHHRKVGHRNNPRVKLTLEKPPCISTKQG